MYVCGVGISGSECGGGGGNDDNGYGDDTSSCGGNDDDNCVFTVKRWIGIRKVVKIGKKLPVNN